MNQQWFDQVRQSGLGHTETFEATYDLGRAVLARGVPGDFVECGVYAGAQCAIMARAIMDHIAATHDYEMGQMPRVHLFDSFAGIPAPGEHDQELSGNKGGESACSLEDVKANMKRWGIPDQLLVYWEGLFCNSIPAAVSFGKLVTRPEAVRYADARRLERIATLRLDGDLYESTKPVMEYLYPLVSPGGWVIVDDWNLSGCRKAVMEHVVPAPVYWKVPTK